jgi:drug/metabolite transporter (DMT)-like permease
MVYVFALVGEVLLAIGFVLQQHSAAGAPLTERLSPRLLFDLAHRPLWLVGIAVMVGGQLCGAAALDKGSLTVVEPLFSAKLLFALPLAAAWTRKRLGAREYLGAAVLIVGLTTFILAAGPSPVESRTVSPLAWLVAGLVVFGAAGALVSVAKRWCDFRAQATLLAAGAGLLYGLQDALTQHTVLLSGHGWVGVFTTWQPYGLLAVAIAGLILGQSAFATAPLPASLPAITSAGPICGIGLGASLFGEHVRLGAPFVVVEVFSLALMVLGICTLARSPIVTGSYVVEPT